MDGRAGERIKRFVGSRAGEEEGDAGEEVHGAFSGRGLGPGAIEFHRLLGFGDEVGAGDGRVVAARAFEHGRKILVHAVGLVPAEHGEAKGDHNGSGQRDFFVIL